MKSEYNVSALDNKNRANVYTSIPNVKQSNYPEANGRNTKIYRAYAYLKDDNGSILLLSNPIYYTVYDIGTITYFNP